MEYEAEKSAGIVEVASLPRDSGFSSSNDIEAYTGEFFEKKIRDLFEENERKYGSDLGEALFNLWDQSQDVSEGLLFELVQNALDAGASRIIASAPDENSFHFFHDSARREHQGMKWEEVRSLASFKVSTKGLSDVGFMGIGFKSVFKDYHRVEVHTTSGPSFFFQIDTDSFDRALWIGSVLPRHSPSPFPMPDGFTTCFCLSNPVKGSITPTSLSDETLALVGLKGLKFFNDRRIEVDRASRSVSVDALKFWYFSATLDQSEEIYEQYIRYRLSKNARESDFIKAKSQQAKKRNELRLLVKQEGGVARIHAVLPLSIESKFSFAVFDAPWLLSTTRSHLRTDNVCKEWNRLIVREGFVNVICQYLAWLPSRPSTMDYRILGCREESYQRLEVLYPDMTEWLREKLVKAPFPFLPVVCAVPEWNRKRYVDIQATILCDSVERLVMRTKESAALLLSRKSALFSLDHAIISSKDVHFLRELKVIRLFTENDLAEMWKGNPSLVLKFVELHDWKTLWSSVEQSGLKGWKSLPLLRSFDGSLVSGSARVLCIGSEWCYDDQQLEDISKQLQSLDIVLLSSDCSMELLSHNTTYASMLRFDRISLESLLRACFDSEHFSIEDLIRIQRIASFEVTNVICRRSTEEDWALCNTNECTLLVKSKDFSGNYVHEHVSVAHPLYDDFPALPCSFLPRVVKQKTYSHEAHEVVERFLHCKIRWPDQNWKVRQGFTLVDFKFTAEQLGIIEENPRLFALQLSYATRAFTNCVRSVPEAPELPFVFTPSIAFAQIRRIKWLPSLSGELVSPVEAVKNDPIEITKDFEALWKEFLEPLYKNLRKVVMAAKEEKANGIAITAVSPRKETSSATHQQEKEKLLTDLRSLLKSNPDTAFIHERRALVADSSFFLTLDASAILTNSLSSGIDSKEAERCVVNELEGVVKRFGFKKFKISNIVWLNEVGESNEQYDISLSIDTDESSIKRIEIEVKGVSVSRARPTLSPAQVEHAINSYMYNSSTAYAVVIVTNGIIQKAILDPIGSLFEKKVRASLRFKL